MLQKLFIRNYAIIESVEIEFSNKLNIITGETGAGKSILVGALGLILGERADSSVLFNATQKCIVEGSFSIRERSDIQKILQQGDLDADEEIVIRREVASTGKSRAFINDTPVTLSQLKQFTSLLVDLHQQFDTLELGNSDFQREVIDALAAHKTVLKQYQEAYTQYSSTQKALAAAKDQQASANKELDYYTFLYTELEEAQWKENELETLDAELKLLGNAENIKSVLDKIGYQLNEGEQPLVQQLKGISNQLQSLHDFHAAIPGLVQRLQSAQIELRDITDEIEHINNGIRFDEERIQVVSDRLALGYKLLKKHGVQTTNELLVIQNNLQQQLDKVLNLDTEIAQLEKKAATQLQQAQQLAQTLTVNRQKQVAPFEKNTDKLLTQVGMPNARIKIAINPAALNVTGGDAIEFLFDANKSNRFEPLKKVASGGELSRLMLCIKSLVAASVQLPTLIFDEIDTGISGEAARQVGIIMKDLGQSHQVIAITHQPQIAAKADAHFFVYKKEKDEKINTRIKLLSAEERVDTIAQMLSGEKPTASALENAREMMNLKI
ncbi:DNA repair protein RecN [Agriterribacter humi]|jgi:DNA repair protein RecN (Recombination protein N)|uniref:DNA repair protein RecN n=1 Tax=Agriterribacter humi TaxID=1104781 RepID=UPI0012650C9C|nr:DNA repair protein RecN [Agriterribacter humi]